MRRVGRLIVSSARLELFDENEKDVKLLNIEEHQGWAHFELWWDEASVQFSMSTLDCCEPLGSWDNLNLKSIQLTKSLKHAGFNQLATKKNGSRLLCKQLENSRIFDQLKIPRKSYAFFLCVSALNAKKIPDICHERVKMFSSISNHLIQDLHHPYRACSFVNICKESFWKSERTARKLQETKSTIDW